MYCSSQVVSDHRKQVKERDGMPSVYKHFVTYYPGCVEEVCKSHCMCNKSNIEVHASIVHGKSIIVCTQVFQFYSPKNNGRSSPSITSIRMKSLAQSCIFLINLQCIIYNVATTMRNTMRSGNQLHILLRRDIPEHDIHTYKGFLRYDTILVASQLRSCYFFSCMLSI